jgi:hypothetical protein
MADSTQPQGIFGQNLFSGVEFKLGLIYDAMRLHARNTGKTP